MYTPLLSLKMAPSDEELQRFRQDLARALQRACPSWLESRRDDLLQLAMLRVMNVLQREENVVLATSYLYKVAHAVVVDEIRRAQWRREAAFDDGNGEPAAPSREAGPEQRVHALEIGRGIDDCLAALAEPRRLAVTLHLQGHSVAEAAGLLGWTVKRTENLTYRGLSDLRTCLAAKGLKP
jgi:RNA polymerase sigma-70 factor (ECF subfamily)